MRWNLTKKAEQIRWDFLCFFEFQQGRKDGYLRRGAGAEIKESNDALWEAWRLVNALLFLQTSKPPDCIADDTETNETNDTSPNSKQPQRHLNQEEKDKQDQLRNVLVAFANHNPTVGYCQGSVDDITFMRFLWGFTWSQQIGHTHQRIRAKTRPSRLIRCDVWIVELMRYRPTDRPRPTDRLTDTAS